MINKEYSRDKIHLKLFSMVFFLVCVFCITVPVFVVKSQTTNSDISKNETLRKIRLSTQQEKVIISNFSQLAEDKEGFLSIQKAIKNLDFKKSTVEKPNFGYTSSSHWCRFKIENTANAAQIRWLEVQYPLLDSVWLYEVDSAQNIIQVRLAGDKMPYNQREVKNPDLVFVLNIDARKTKTFYMRFRTEGTMSFPVVLWQPQAFSEETATDSFSFGIYYGIIVVMILYNLFIFFSLRDKAYLYYVLTIASIALFQLAFNGLGFEYLWGNFYQFNDIAIPFFIASLALTSLIFGRQFLHSKDLLPKLDKIILFYIGLVSIELVCTVFIPYKIMVKVTSITGTIGILILFYMAIMSYRKGYKTAIYFLAAWSLFLLGVLLPFLEDLEFCQLILLLLILCKLDLL